MTHPQKTNGQTTSHGKAPVAGPVVTARRSSYQATALSPEEIAQVESPDPSGAVEVVALYKGEAHVVRHFADPSAGRPGRLSLAAVVLGLGLCVGGVALFGSQLAYVAYQERKAKEVALFVKERGMPDKFVPRVRSQGAVELGAAAGFVLGFFGFLWGAIRARDEMEKPGFSIGEHPKSSYHTPTDALPPEVPRFPLLASDGAAFTLTFTSKMEGYVELGGERILLPDLVQRGLARVSAKVPSSYTYPIPPGMRAHLELGDNAFVISTVAPGKAVAGASLPARAAALVTSPLFVTTGGSVALTLAFFGLLLLRPASSEAMETDSLESRSRMQAMVRNELKNQQKDREAKPEPDKKPDPQKADPFEVTQANATQGKRDDRTRRLSRGAASPGADASKPAVGRGSGMLGVLQSMNPKLSSMFSRDSAMSSASEDALGALVGHTVGDDSGLGALDIGGGGRAGGGAGAGGENFGGFGDFGKGGGGPFGGGVRIGGTGTGIPGYRPKEPVTLRSRGEVHSGTLDESIIRRVIRSRLSEISYCYVSVGLPSKPDMAGLVKVSFTITPAGTVGQASIVGSTLGHGPTEACITAAVRRWRFPKPEGSMPFVIYPFHFRPVGSSASGR